MFHFLKTWLTVVLNDLKVKWEGHTSHDDDVDTLSTPMQCGTHEGE